MIRTILVCEAQVPFVQGGAEFHVRELVGQLRQHGYETELVSVPFKWYPKSEILAHAAAWRLLDLSESNGRPIDLVIATKFPTYFVRHPNKVVWLIHQYRAAYELAGTRFSDFFHLEDDVATARAADRARHRDARGVPAAFRQLGQHGRADAPVQRARRRAAVSSSAPRRAAARGPAQGYVLSVGRLESVKRVDLAIRALAHGPADLSLVIAGTGTQRAALEELTASLDLSGRVRFLGEVADDDLVDLYAGALGVIFPPYDEDYGYVTIEAFLAHKPVVTTTDAGGPNEFVIDGVNGCVCEADPEALAEALGRLHADPRRAAAWGHAGYERARTITWEGVIERLVG